MEQEMHKAQLDLTFKYTVSVSVTALRCRLESEEELM